MGRCKREKETPFSGSLLFRLSLSCVGFPIGPGALPALIAGQPQQPKCEHHGQIDSMSREIVPNLGTKRFGRGRFEQSFQKPPRLAIGCNVAFQLEPGFVKG